MEDGASLEGFDLGMMKDEVWVGVVSEVLKEMDGIC